MSSPSALALELALELALATVVAMATATAALGQEAPASASAAASATGAALDPLLRRGQRVFLTCASCHDIGGSSGKMGPNLSGVYGRRAASLPGYDYSKSLRELTLVWGDAELDAWLRQPTALAAGTTMAFLGLPEARDRLAVIAWLKAAK